MSTLLAEFSLAPLFRDHAVLQRDKPVPVWGKAAPGEKVEVRFRDQQKEAVADGEGNWKAVLDPLVASAQPGNLRIQAGRSVRNLKDVLVGDVWLCSGQSNMGWKLSRANDAEAEIAAADHPQIRCFDVPQTVSDVPADFVRGVWDVCRPAVAGRFSAVAFYFGRELHREAGVPIGLITSSWGGTEIEPWMSGKALRADPAYPAICKRSEERLAGIPALMQRHQIRLERHAAARAKAEAEGVEFNEPPPREPEGVVCRKTPSALFNAMIHPFIPAALRGIAWYQGESNSGRYAEYRTLFPGLIRQWRNDFGQGDLPFYFVQIANWKREGEERVVAGLREAQMEALKLPQTGMAVAIDVGDPDTVHPPNKQEVGRRLALVALAKTYGKPVPFSGPLYREAVAEGGKMRVRFDHAEGLRFREGVPNSFEIAGADRVFHPAEAAIEGAGVLVSSRAVPDPVAVRYAFLNFPPSSLYNAANLPASPFRSDHWPLETAKGIDPGPDAAEK